MRPRLLVVSIALVLAVTTVCSAQIDRASISGTISDPTGAVVPGAQVTVLQTATQTTSSTTSNSSGTYLFIGLPIGDYTLTAERTGFKKVTRTHLNLTPGLDVRQDFTLEVGSGAKDVVEVKGAAPLVEERTTALGVSLEPQHMVDLPLQVNQNRRTPYSYLAAVPGVENAGFANNVNGGVGLNNEVLVDGLGAEYNPAVGSVINGPPSVEVLDSFKVETSANAEYGATGGGYISFATKSGTNQLHGSVYDYVRNNALDSRSFFAQDVAIYKQHELGASLGGPVYIPKLYDGRNKMFFYFNFTTLILHNNSSGSILSVPTAAMQQGDFSAFLGSQIGTDNLGRPVSAGEIFDPSTSRRATVGTLDPTTGLVATGTGLVRDPFPNNLIPGADFSSVSSKYQSHFPNPNLSGLTNNLLGFGGVSIQHEFSDLAKIDYVTAKGRLSVSHSWLRTPPFLQPTVIPDFFSGSTHWVRNNHVRVAYSRTLSPSIVNEFLVGMNRTNQWSGSTTAANSGAEVGMKGVFSTCVPVANIADYGSWGIGGCSGGEADTNWKIQDNVHLLHGKHSLAFGASYYTWNANFPTDGISGGAFNFLPAETGLPGSAFANQTGVGYASFLLGAVDSANTLRPFEKGLRSKYFGVFVQDEYRVTPKLTLNAGLRWEYQPSYHELHDTATSFSPTTPNPAAGGLLGALEFLGTGTGRSGKTRFSDPYTKGFGPRVGFAYKLTANTVLRGSYGLFWAPVSQWSGEFEFRAGFRPTLNVASGDAGATPAFNWTNGFPIGQFNINPVLDPSLGNGSGASWHDPSQAHPPAQVQIINFSVQRELGGQMLLEVAYAGNLSHHIGTANLMEINQLDYAKYGSLGSLLLADINSPEAIAAGYRAPFPGFKGSVGQSLRPYPQFLGINGGNPSIGNSLYHSVQIKLQKRFSNGLSFLVGETLAKSLTDTATAGNLGNVGSAVFANGVQDAFNRRAEKGMDTGQPFPSHLVLSYAYELPFGPGKKFLNHQDVFSKHVVGGWTIGGIHSYASGGPLGFSTNIRLLTTGDSAAAGVPSTPVRPNFASGKTASDIRSGVSCGAFDPASDLYFKSGVLVDPATNTFGNLAPNYSNVRSCARYNEDISLHKAFPFKEERAKVKIGADFFNIFNRHIFGAPVANIDSVAFGKITSASAGRSIQFFARIEF